MGHHRKPQNKNLLQWIRPIILMLLKKIMNNIRITAYAAAKVIVYNGNRFLIILYRQVIQNIQESHAEFYLFSSSRLSDIS